MLTVEYAVCIRPRKPGRLRKTAGALKIHVTNANMKTFRIGEYVMMGPLNDPFDFTDSIRIVPDVERPPDCI